MIAIASWSGRLSVIGGLLALALCGSGTALAQRELQVIPDPDTELERATFEVAEGFEVTLFAADPSIANPIQMDFDAEGRLWIASSEVYPHIKPGQKPTDKILVVEDTDQDGTADRTTVFADGLLIPTGILAGDGGVYVANSTELIHLRDTDGDGRADQRRVVLRGFGTEDTHHLLHTLRWGPDGAMYMNQSIYIHSHIETSHGVRRLNGGGIWRFRPETMKLDVLCRGFVNPWGHHFDKWGQSFATDGAYGEGINYVFPGSVFVTAVGLVRRVEGLNPGSPKHCGLEILSGRHLPDDWQGNMITNDFRAHRVCRFVISESGSGYVSRQETELIKSTHVAFRPVDVRQGPDGAIYIADWYNPIIQHGEVDFRDPRRDHVHGRIWRVAAKDRPPAPRPQLVGAETPELLEQLKSPEGWVRQHAKLILKQRGAAAVLPALTDWMARLDPQDAEYEHHRLEALWLHQCLDVVNQPLLETLLASGDHRVRAAAMRVVPQWGPQLDHALDLLARGVRDAHPRVRLEAVRGLAEQGLAEAAEAALAALDQPMDSFLDFALWQCMRDLAPAWLPQVNRGELDFGGRVNYLTFALQAVDSPDVARPLLRLVERQRIAPDRVSSVLQLIAKLGGEPELTAVWQRCVADGPLPLDARAALLRTLAETYRLRKVQPTVDAQQLAGLLDNADASLRTAALQLAGALRIEPLRGRIEQLASKNTDPALRPVAIEALAALGGPESVKTLSHLANGSDAWAERAAATRALSLLDVAQAAAAATTLLGELPSDVAAEQLIGPLLAQRGGPEALAKALSDKQLPTDVARRVVRTVRDSGQPSDSLIAAIETAGQLSDAGWRFDPALAAELVELSRTQGDAHRGESIYRRQELQCLKCHAIGGAGGTVGPDLSSIGASAQPDYLVESLLAPNAKVKENYHAVVIVADGKVTAGIPLRRTEETLVLRDAQDQEVVIALDDIEEQQEGRSLMPDGTVDSLTKDELADLVRFLSELGKVGPFAVGNASLVRRWEALSPTDEAYHKIRRNSFDVAASNDTALIWQPATTRVSGDLHLEELPSFVDATYVVDKASSLTAFIRCQVTVAPGGASTLLLNDASGLALWIDGKPSSLETSADGTTVSLGPGQHTLTLAVDLKRRTAAIRAEILE